MISCGTIDQSHKSKPLVLLVCNDLDATVLEAGAFVGISNGDVEGKVVRECVVGFGVTELGKRSIVDGEFRCSA